MDAVEPAMSQETETLALQQQIQASLETGERDLQNCIRSLTRTQEHLGDIARTFDRTKADLGRIERGPEAQPLRTALAALYAAQEAVSGPSELTSDERTNRAIRDLEEAIFYALSDVIEPDPTAPRDLAFEAARTLVCDLVTALLPVPSAAEMQRRWKARNKARKQQQQVRAAARQAGVKAI